MNRLKIALFLTAFYMIAEAVGGWLANSLALIADAGHMLTDTAALTLTLGAIWFASRPATERKTYGYYRLEILAAFINAVVLVLLSLWVIYEAYERWSAPPEVKGLELTLIAIGGLIINLIGAWLLHSDHKDDLNMHGAWLHVIGDALGSVTAIAAGVLIVGFGWLWADAVSSLLISLIIIYGSWNLIRETINVLLEGTPAHINIAEVERAILETENVKAVHDLHVWTITSGMEALSAHVQYDETIAQPELLKRLRKRLHDEFGIDHLTIQMETPDFEEENVHFCQTGAHCFESKSREKAFNS
ncbi:MAG: cation diffusion facilitator family transporter [Pyrinomonadaceae bacterium]|nr:cation diffusion facilitator family transporter [Pyrinomonadaceae bacterium]